MNDKIQAALKQLDPNNPNHWTQEGLPRLETIRILLGDPSVAREQVTSAAPTFSRTNLVVGEQPKVSVTLGQPGLPGVPQDEVTPPPVVKETQEQQLTRLDAEIAELDKTIDKATAHRINLNNKRDQIISDIERKRPEVQISNVVASYHDSVKKQLQIRADTRRAVQESGVNLRELNKLTSGAPVDAARKKRP